MMMMIHTIVLLLIMIILSLLIYFVFKNKIVNDSAFDTEEIIKIETMQRTEIDRIVCQLSLLSCLLKIYVEERELITAKKPLDLVNVRENNLGRAQLSQFHVWFS